jgi:hypothetical protein
MNPPANPLAVKAMAGFVPSIGVERRLQGAVAYFGRQRPDEVGAIETPQFFPNRRGHQSSAR